MLARGRAATGKGLPSRSFGQRNRRHPIRPGEEGLTTVPDNNSGIFVALLSDYALASRLSYFLWSSAPDDELLAVAAKGELKKPEVLLAQTRRMLKDPKVAGLATEFGGNWLDFRRFEEHNGVDRVRFPAFTNELRQAMFEEPIRYFMDVAARNRSVTSAARA